MTNAEIIRQDGFAALREPLDEILPERLPEPAVVPAILLKARTAALGLISAGTLAASAATFSQSFRGLLEWAQRHKVTGNFAYYWPVQVDIFIVVPELVLFVGVLDNWPRRSRIAAWCVTAAGTAASVGANIGHVQAHVWTDRLTAAVPPVTAAATLAFGLLTLKWVIRRGRR